LKSFDEIFQGSFAPKNEKKKQPETRRVSSEEGRKKPSGVDGTVQISGMFFMIFFVCKYNKQKRVRGDKKKTSIKG
jgi:hypothetical protein